MKSQTLLDLHNRFIAHLRAGNRSEKTIIHYNDSFRDLLRYLEARDLPATLDAITTESCQGFVTWLRETPTRVWRGKTTRSIHGLAGRLRDLKAFLHYLEFEEILDRKVRVPSVKVPQADFAILSDEDLVALFRCPHLAAKGDQAIRNRAIVAILIDCGLRLAEISGMQLEDVEMPDHLLKVTGKGNKIRRVPFSEGTADYLRDWVRVRGREPGPFFLLSYHGVRMMLSRVKGESGIDIWTHRFRHTAASKLIQNGADLSYVRRIMGHSHIGTTLLYVHHDNADLREKHQAASPLASIGIGGTPKRRRFTVD
jgi:site-specific recombinase XerD